MRATVGFGLSASLRSYTPEDAAFVAELAVEAFAEYGARPASYVASAIQRPETRTWLAVEGGAPVGLVVLELEGRRAAVLAVAVTLRARGRGIGGLLMDTVERAAQTQGARRLTLCTADSNLAALDLFLRRGFHIVRRKPAYYSRRQDACELEKSLASIA